VGRYERRVNAASIPSTWTTGAFARAGRIYDFSGAGDHLAWLVINAAVTAEIAGVMEHYLFSF